MGWCENGQVVGGCHGLEEGGVGSASGRMGRAVERTGGRQSMLRKQGQQNGVALR